MERESDVEGDLSEPDITQKPRKKSVVVLYNQVGHDWYETLKQVDPAKLPFKPEYPIHVATVREEYEEIVKALRAEGYRARVVNLEEDLRKLERLLKRSRPDVIFNLVEGFHDTPDLEGAVAGMFDLYRMRYTGSQPFALALCQDKAFTKEILVAHNVPTPRFKLFEEFKAPKRIGLSYPLIVKPTWEDASAGMDRNSVVHNATQLAERLEYAFDEFDPPILVEEFVDGPELHVSIWGNDPPEVLPPVEFDFSQLPADHPPLISYDMKWNPLDEAYHRVHTICPARISKSVLRKVEKIAKHAYEVTWCRDYARLDIRLRGDKPYVLEVNPNPDLTEGVSFMDSAEAAGYSFSGALARIVGFALEREPVPERPPVPAAELPPPDPALTITPPGETQPAGDHGPTPPAADQGSAPSQQ